ncbi:MAG: diguanylate cyclase/phosphodiesterase with and sensor(s) [Acidimicrobiaceae bacterium]|nr:diguanylate cyclase/phosphodiesterase with and sensor(s) [Acidimicrobiaceae bacterium]
MTSNKKKKPSAKRKASRPKDPTSAISQEPSVEPTQKATDYYAALAEVGRRSQDLMLVIDGTGSVKYANPVTLETFGLSLEEGLGTSAFDYVHPDDLQRVISQFLKLLEMPRGSIRDVVRTIAANGETREIELVSTNALDSKAVAGIIVNGRDVTEHNQYVKQLQALEERFRLAFEDNMAPMIFTDLDDRVFAANDAFCTMIGFEREEILGRDSTLFTYPDDVGIAEDSLRRVARGEIVQSRYVKRYLRKDGRLIHVEVLRSPARDEDGNILYHVISERDITDERTLAAQLSHQALHDTLTGLANRALFHDRLEQAHSKMVREGTLCAVLLLDLDDFKGVNDSFGHLAGDQLLISVARRLEHVARSSDTLCRFGGDEFLYLAEGLTSAKDAEFAATRLLEALAEPFFLSGAQIQQRASIGVVVFDASASQTTEFVQDADVALYEAKREGKGRFVFFTPTMHQQAVNRFTLIQELRQALQAGDLSMHYQPIFELATTRIVGFESLMRWHHVTRGWVPPSVFIPAAEQSELIRELGYFALREVVATAASWDAVRPDAKDLYVTVNLSARQFHDPELVSVIEQILSENSFASERLVIEITESVTLLNVTETMIVMEQLSRLGISFALDDFGTGFSSLSYLALLQPKVIKIDQSFVSPSIERPRNKILLEAIISLGHKLNMTMLAEGIETATQLERLRQADCELGQGFLWSPGVPKDEITALLTRTSDQW